MYWNGLVVLLSLVAFLNEGRFVKCLWRKHIVVHLIDEIFKKYIIRLLEKFNFIAAIYVPMILFLISISRFCCNCIVKGANIEIFINVLLLYTF